MCYTPDVRIKCVKGTTPSYGETFIEELALDLVYHGQPMSGLAGYTGTMKIQSSEDGAKLTELSIQTFPKWSDISFYGEKEYRYSLATFSDIFDEKGIQRIGTLTISNTESWKKKFELICERIL